MLVLVAEDGQVALDGHSGRVTRHQDHGLLPVSGRSGIGLAHDDEDRTALIGNARDPPLVTVDDVLITVAHDGCLDIGGVRGGRCGFGHREGGPDLSTQQRRQPALALLWGGKEVERLHVAGVGRLAVDRFRGDDRRPARDLGNRGVLHVGQAAEVWVEQVPQPTSARGGLQTFHHGRVFVGPVLVQVGSPLALRREDLLVHELPHALRRVCGLGGEFEIHVKVLGRGCPARTARSVRSPCRGRRSPGQPSARQRPVRRCPAQFRRT